MNFFTSNFKAKDFVKAFTIYLFMLPIAIMLTVAVADPFQFYRKNKISDPVYFSNNETFQNPGLLKNYDYETILVGSSMTENADIHYLERALETKAIKVSASGSNFKDQSETIAVAANTGKLKKVVWSMDEYSYTKDPRENRQKGDDHPYYFYDTNPLNDYHYLFNYDQVKFSLNILQNKKPKDNRSWGTDVNELYKWYTRREFSKEEVLTVWNYKIKDRPYFVPSEKRNIELRELSTSKKKLIQENIEINILPVIKENPDIKFIVYFPPYSIANYMDYYWTNREGFSEMVFFKSYFANETKYLKNVTTYDFQYDYDIILDLDNYSDFDHHTWQISNLLVDKISYRRSKFSPDTILQDTENLALLAEKTDLEKL